MRNCQRTCQSGAAMVEGALSIGFFLFLLVGVLELTIIVYRYVAVQHAISTVGRTVITGATDTGLNREDTIRNRLRKRASAYGIRLTNADISICPLLPSPASISNCTPQSAGQPGGLFGVTVRLPVRFMHSNLTTMETTVVMMNEVF